MKITQLTIYPVKSLQGIPLREARLTAQGLAGDRRWMVVDDVGRFVTQRQLPGMARIGTGLEEDALVLTHPGMTPLRVPLARPARERLPVYVWDDRCAALDEGDEARQWLGAVLGDLRGSGLRLVRFDERERRRVEPHCLLPGEQAHTGFADGYPFLVATTASLAALNRALEAGGGEALPMNRFRPNIVIEGGEPFAEDGWREIAGDGWRLGLRKPCQRCKITTVDQISGEIRHPGEPLKTLMALKPRLAFQGAFFGQNAILLAGEGQPLRVGAGISAG
ncbi:MOSC N-terminal beta barrel domain-containing protein [Halomonas sp. BM-2019]|uniref:MOSC domain-containing protein n=1 Tax=Halomonas sp. BM-2019 TaxID=2811227 RepID=UPI001B3C3566|nr:MAG: MOSC N-terminal beta barrel domain-containing protein [Halomonas sp. BM-2019]